MPMQVMIIVATRGSDVLVGGRGLDLFKYDRIADSPNKKITKTPYCVSILEGDRIDLTEIAEIDFIGREISQAQIKQIGMVALL